jgi:hypothetical protein
MKLAEHLGKLSTCLCKKMMKLDMLLGHWHVQLCLILILVEAFRLHNDGLLFLTKIIGFYNDELLFLIYNC